MNFFLATRVLFRPQFSSNIMEQKKSFLLGKARGFCLFGWLDFFFESMC